MRTIELGETGITSSVIGFGCSALLGRTGRKTSLRSLAAAWDAGINFYDTARSYGYGESEAILGEFLRTRRDRAVISTKFGILASRQPLWKRVAKPAARTLLSLAPSSYGVLHKQAKKQFESNQFSVGVLEESIHESLRKLKTDYIDLLFMHAAPASVLDQNDLLAALEKLVDSGKVRASGISAGPDVIDLTLQRRPPPLRALQFPCNVFDLSAASHISTRGKHGFATIANHPFGGPARVEQGRAILNKIADSDATPSEIRARLGTVNDAVFADVIMNVILGSPEIDIVVPAMMKLPHLKNNVDAIVKSRFQQTEIDWLRARLSGLNSASNYLNSSQGSG